MSRLCPDEKIEGWILIFRKEGTELLCTARVVARSSDSASFFTKSGDHQGDRESKAKYAVKQDFRKKIGLAMVASVKRASKTLTFLNPTRYPA